MQLKISVDNLKANSNNIAMSYDTKQIRLIPILPRWVSLWSQVKAQQDPVTTFHGLITIT